MSRQPMRNPTGGLVDRTRRLRFTFDGRVLEGLAGDSLASALLANGVRLVGRSFKYHRPRGIFAAGLEEPNALVQLRRGDRSEPNLRASEVELFDGLEAASQNRWPLLGLDLAAINDRLSPLLPAGFYYKTFMAPRRLWPLYERAIRKMAGLGRSPSLPDPDRYARRYAHCDVLVVGAGPAGLAAALAAARTGARVMLVEAAPRLGGSLVWCPAAIDAVDGLAWVERAEAELRALPEVTLLTRATAFGYYDHNLVTVLERVADHLPVPPPHTPRQRLWQVRAAEVVLTTGAIERGLVFADNDRPGVMLASAARAYANVFAVRPGRRAVIATNNDSAYGAARDLQAAGVEVVAIVDTREATRRATPAGVRRIGGSVVARAEGGRAVEGVVVLPAGEAERAAPGQRLACDLVCVAGGWNPTLHLHAQARGETAFDPQLAAFVPGPTVQRHRSAGAARGRLALAACLLEGFEAGRAAATAAGFESGPFGTSPEAVPDDEPTPIRPFWVAPLPRGRRRKRFVDQQNDVTVDDVALAVREGYDSIEHLKRYTTLGMGTDQGRTSGIEGLALLAGLLGKEPGEVGHTTFRPPFTPVSLGAVAGGETGEHFAPLRRTPMDGWHERRGALFVNAGHWRRPACYPRPGEDIAAATAREAAAVRASVGLVDVSTLGKIELQGPDAVLLVERAYCNGWRRLPIGRCRYGLMLREDGIVFDDGVTARLGESHYVMSTTTAGAAAVLRHLEHLVQVVWPGLDVQLLAVTEEWATIALAGPRAREVLARAAPGLDVSGKALPPQGVLGGDVAGVPARLFRISFSGELAYEIAVPASHGLHLWAALLEAGAPLGIVAYGTEAMSVLRIEKGHVAGGELSGRTTPDDLGLGSMVSTTKEFIGRAWLGRLRRAGGPRRQLVGLVPLDGQSAIARASQLVAKAEAPPPARIEGEVTATCHSPTLGHPIALALVEAGRARLGSTLHACSPLTGREVPVRLVHPVFVDPGGERQSA